MDKKFPFELPKTILYPFILIFIGLLIYSFNLKNPLFWDDDDFIVKNKFIQTIRVENLKNILQENNILLTKGELELWINNFNTNKIEAILVDEADVERAIELSTTTYCGVSAMLKKAMTIKHSYRIVESE